MSEDRPDFIDSTGYLLAQVGRRARGAWTGVLAERGLTPSAHAVLLVLRQRGPLTLSALAAAIDTDPRNMGPILDSMTAHIERRQDERDRRRRTVGLTPGGRAVADELAEATRLIEQELLEPLGHEDRTTLHNLLVRLADGAERADRG